MPVFPSKYLPQNESNSSAPLNFRIVTLSDSELTLAQFTYHSKNHRKTPAFRPHIPKIYRGERRVRLRVSPITSPGEYLLENLSPHARHSAATHCAKWTGRIPIRCRRMARSKLRAFDRPDCPLSAARRSIAIYIHQEDRPTGNAKARSDFARNRPALASTQHEKFIQSKRSPSTFSRPEAACEQRRRRTHHEY